MSENPKIIHDDKAEMLELVKVQKEYEVCIFIPTLFLFKTLLSVVLYNSKKLFEKTKH